MKTPIIEIGDADGKIALYLNERSANDLLAMFRYDDLFSIELGEAIDKAYPVEDVDG